MQEDIKDVAMAAMSHYDENKPLVIKTARGSRTDPRYKNPKGISGELNNIDQGVSPFEDNGGDINATNSIKLCQKAYWNIPIFRSTIDIQTEFANSKLHFHGSNKRSTKFFEAWYQKIEGWALGDHWFREWFRSGNVFVYCFKGELNLQEYRKITRATKEIPLRYILLNPADMRCHGASTFVDAQYDKVLTDYEIARLRGTNTTEEEKAFLKSLSPEARKAIKDGARPIITLPSDKLSATFCSKQDYEPLAIPMYYPVLTDINLKLQFKKAEQIIARAADYILLLVTCGDPLKEASHNGQIRQALTELFAAESIGRVLVADYSTEAEFILPDLNKIFGPAKYEAVNSDIASGLMNIFWGEDKFANSMVKIQVFLERLNQAREAYLNSFLKPQMKRIAQELGFQEIPDPSFEKINLKDEVEYMKIYTRLAELNLLTPDETFEAFRSQNLPLKQNSIESQTEYRKLRDKGLYEPLLAKPKEEEGRKSGTKVPTQRKKVGPIGGSKFSISKIHENFKMIHNISYLIEAAYKEKHQMKRLSKKHKDVCQALVESLVANEKRENWESKIVEYLAQPNLNLDISDEVMEICEEHNITPLLGAVLANSVTETENECSNLQED